MVARLRRSRLFAVFAKSVFAVSIFTFTVGAYAYITDDPRLRTHFPLPDGGVEDAACSTWFIGSSSINKWQSLDADLAPWRAHNRGVNGAMIGELEQRFDRETHRDAPTVIVVYAGENDIAIGGASADTAARRMTHFLATIRTRLPRTPIFLVDMKPSPTRWIFRPEQLRYNAIMRRVLAGRTNIRLLTVGDGLLVDGSPGPFYVDDGVHLNAAGYARWGHDIRAGVEAGLPQTAVAYCRTKKR